MRCHGWFWLIKTGIFFEVDWFKKELLESNVVDRPQGLSERLGKSFKRHSFPLQKLKFIICKKLNDLHTAQTSSYKSIENNDFVNKGNGNNDKNDKCQSNLWFYNNNNKSVWK